MTEAQVLANINTFIVANGSNAITADILRPILADILGQPNEKIGELANLQTVDKSSIVNAINEALNASGQGFDIYVGPTDPNITPPGSFGIGDWYIRGGNSLYQYNGSEWVLLTGSGVTNLSMSSDGNSVTIESDTGNNATIPLANGTKAGVSSNNFSDSDKSKLEGISVSSIESFTYSSGAFEFTLSRAPANVDVYIGRTFQIPGDDYSLTGNKITMLYDLDPGDRATIRLY